MSAFEDEIGGLIEDIKRYSMGDARIEFCLDEMLKRIRAEVDALALEARDLDRAQHVPPARPWGSWGRQAGSMDDGDWRNSGIA